MSDDPYGGWRGNRQTRKLAVRARSHEGGYWLAYVWYGLTEHRTTYYVRSEEAMNHELERANG